MLFTVEIVNFIQSQMGMISTSRIKQFQEHLRTARQGKKFFVTPGLVTMKRLYILFCR